MTIMWTSFRRHGSLPLRRPAAPRLLAAAEPAARRPARSRSGSPRRSRPSVRLALLSALSAAAEEITGELAPGAVDVRLRGGDLGFVVTAPAVTAPRTSRPAADPGPRRRAAAGRTPTRAAPARSPSALPEQLKTRIEDAAAREGVSVNTWLVRAVSRRARARRRRGLRRPAHRQPLVRPAYTGWVR